MQDKEHMSQDTKAQLVEGSIEWRRTLAPVSGALKLGFVPEGNRILVELNPLVKKPPDWDSDSLWVDIACLAADDLIIRSELWELPQGEQKDFALRTLLYSLCDWVRTYGTKVDLSAGAQRDVIELAFWLEIPSEAALGYLQALRSARGTASSRSMAYSQPRELLLQRLVTDKDRMRIAQSATQLVRLFTGNLLWSVFRWHEHRLCHIVEFSIEKRHEKILIRSFGLTNVSS